MLLLIALQVRSQCLQPVASYTYDCLTSSALASVTVIPPLGTPPYSYTWIPGAHSTASVSNLAMGTYTIYVKDANNCMYFAMLIIVNPYTPSNLVFTNTMVSCFGGSNGRSSVAFNGSNGPPYTYTWSQSGTPLYNTQVANNLTAGKYVVTVKDKDGCKVTNTVTITEPPAINSLLTPTYIACAGYSVNAIITGTGGVGTHSYALNGVPVQTNVSIPAGIHTITTTDQNNCVKQNTVQVKEEPPDQISFQVAKPSCKSVQDGSVTATVSGSYAPYTYTWQGTAANGATLHNIYPGTYTLSITNATGCITNSVVNVIPLPGVLPSYVTRDENCSAADGAFTLSLSGGNPPFTFTTFPGAASGSVVPNLSSGHYSTVIQDSKNCLDTFQVSIGNLSTVVLQISNQQPPQCFSNCTGSFQLYVQNAVPPVTYSVTGTPTTTSASFSNLCAGSYQIRAIDGIGCPATATLDFPVPPAFSFSASASAAICIGREATLSATAEGGSGSHSYVWQPGSLPGRVVSVNPQVTTVYSLQVFDAKNCTLPPFQVTVSVLPPISVNIRSSDAGVCPGTTAQITPTVSGGDGNYSYLWEPGNYSTPSVFVASVTHAEYQLTVKDGCGSPPATKIIPVKLFPVTIPSYSLSADSGCVPLCATFINLTPGARDVVWNYGDRPFEQQGDTTAYCYERAGIYDLRITLTDSNSCRASHTFSGSIQAMQKPVVNYLTEPVTITLNNAEAVTFKNLSAYATGFSWYVNGQAYSSSEELLMSFRETGCTDIRLVGRNSATCRDSVERSICVSEGFNFYMPSAFSPNNDGLNDLFMPKGSGWLFGDYVFEIYNRWGARVFRTNDPHAGWDGGLREHPALPDQYKNHPSDVYAWRVQLTDNEGNPRAFTGSVMLLK